MKKFLAIYTCAENSENHLAWKKLDPQTQKERLQNGFEARELWNTKYRNQIVIDHMSLGSTTKKIDTHGVVDIPSQLGSFVIIQAESPDEAAKIFLDHPHFKYFPGDGIEVLECLDIPDKIRKP